MIYDINSPPYGHSSGSPRMSLMEDHCGKNEMDIKFQIHNMEKEVLWAFIAQSDILSWGKEGLITELQKELNVTDIEHGQILVKINSDELVKRIREWRKGAHEPLSTKVSASGHFTDSVDNALLKKRRPAHPSLSKSEQYVSHDKPYLASIPSFALAQFRNNQQCVELTFSPMESTKIVNHNLQGVLSNKQGGPSQSHLSNGFHTSSTCKFKNCSECFEIRATDTVINEVKQMAYGTENPDPIQLQKALFILAEYERDILQALDKLANVLDEDDSLFNDTPNRRHSSYEELHGNRNIMLASSSFHG